MTLEAVVGVVGMLVTLLVIVAGMLTFIQWGRDS